MTNRHMQSGCYLASERAMAHEEGEKVKLGADPIRVRRTGWEGVALEEWVLE